MKSCYVLFIVVGILYVFVPYFNSCQEQSGAGLELKFSDVDANISQGNPISWSDRKNLPGKKRPQYNRGKYTFWGHQIPLAHQTKLGKFDGQRIPTLSGMELKSSPDSCTSPYSSDAGCVAYQFNKRCEDRKSVV